MVELHVNAGDWLACRTVEELRLHDEGVAVLGLMRGMSDAYIGVPIDGTPVLAGDTMVLYGHAPRLAELDSRKAREPGDAAHWQAVDEHMESDNVTSEADAAEMMAADEMPPRSST